MKKKNFYILNLAKIIFFSKGIKTKFENSFYKNIMRIFF